MKACLSIDPGRGSVRRNRRIKGKPALDRYPSSRRNRKESFRKRKSSRKERKPAFLIGPGRG